MIYLKNLESLMTANYSRSQRCGNMQCVILFKLVASDCNGNFKYCSVINVHIINFPHVLRP